MKRTRPEIAWDPSFLAQHPAFAQFLSTQACWEPFAHSWPTVADYAALAQWRAAKMVNAHSMPLTFHTAAAHLSHYDYERLIEQDARVATRERDWHDLFNALAWFNFPRSKARLHHAQWHELQHGPRSAHADALRLFDENGVIVLCAEPELAHLLTQMRWKQLLWHERQRAQDMLRFLPFGHGLCHKLLRPFVGITGKAVILTVPAHTLAQPMEVLAELADASLASHLHALRSPQALHPLPVLGVPGWWPQDEAFYDNQTYFRPRRELQSRSTPTAFEGEEALPG